MMTHSSGKKFLIIVNSAAYSREYFVRLGNELKRFGTSVSYVLDSHLSDVMSGENRPLPDSWYFTDYCIRRSHEPEGSPSRRDLKWEVLQSDFDRFITFKMKPPLKSNKKLDYAGTVKLLDKFFVEVFDDIKPDAVIYEQVSNSFAMMAYRETVRRNIPFFSLAPARIPGHVEISPTGALRDQRTVGALLAEVRRTGGDPQARAVAAHYIASIDQQVPDYMRKGGAGAVLMSTSLTEKYGNGETFRRFRRLIRYRSSYRQDLAFAYQFGDPLRASWALFCRAIRRKLRMKKVVNLFQTRVIASHYFLYPLHYHPEASTSVLAPDYIDELSVIQAIAFRLPVDVKLVVKEHPSATALQPLPFYRALDSLPNVELVAPQLNAKELARDSIGVICLTSTLGFEAAALNKPVICLGDVLYGYFPNVRMIEHYGELDGALAWAMAYVSIDPETILDAMTAYVEYADAGAFDFRALHKSTAEITRMAQLLISKMVGPHEGQALGDEPLPSLDGAR